MVAIGVEERDQRGGNKAMTKVEFKNAPRPLSEYPKTRKAAVVLYKRGKPFAAVIPLRNADDETLALSTNRKFLKIIDMSRARVKREGTISPGKLRRRLGLEK
jgi:antitoxin (DNA-binding transcriptional repressor) of toxin-antitoxin stability system